MIVNPSDPTGLGLFSKYARNQAMRSKSVRPSSTAKSKSIKPIQPPRKKSVNSDSFSKQESRHQRERKYHGDEAPPVGQYNPSQREKPKLVWDILKVYQHQMHKKKTVEQEQKQAKYDHKEVVATPTETELQAMIMGQPQHMLSTGESLMSSKVSQCMVDMSRMTGRREQVRQSWDWGDADVLQSLGYVKGSITKNIVFDKMQNHPSPKRSINPATNYSFDYKVLKQRKQALLDFSTIKGRPSNQKKEPTYAYQHYEYDNYVWEKNSRVYPNTKTHLVEFRRQINRYSKLQ